MAVRGNSPPVQSFFFFQAEDGIRGTSVTGVQTCALPISPRRGAGGSGAADRLTRTRPHLGAVVLNEAASRVSEIGRASCRERVGEAEGDMVVKEKVKIVNDGNGQLDRTDNKYVLGTDHIR